MAALSQLFRGRGKELRLLGGPEGRLQKREPESGTAPVVRTHVRRHTAPAPRLSADVVKQRELTEAVSSMQGADDLRALPTCKPTWPCRSCGCEARGQEPCRSAFPTFLARSHPPNRLHNGIKAVGGCWTLELGHLFRPSFNFRLADLTRKDVALKEEPMSSLKKNGDGNEPQHPL